MDRTQMSQKVRVALGMGSSWKLSMALGEIPHKQSVCHLKR